MASSKEIREANCVKVTQKTVRGINTIVANCKNVDDNIIVNQEVKTVNGLTSIAISIVEPDAQVYRITKDENGIVKKYYKASLMEQFIECEFKVTFDKNRIFVGINDICYNVWIDEDGICLYTSKHRKSS